MPKYFILLSDDLLFDRTLIDRLINDRFIIEQTLILYSIHGCKYFTFQYLTSVVGLVV